ncbi:unnamed protein product [Closterium sp. Yama58-4]|nr:unnamed protein product [Closterium sp. Yama58-4]
MEEVAVIADAAGPSKFSLLLPSHQGFMMIFQNRPLIVAFISLWVAQFLKPFTLWHWEKRWDFKRILGSGGMPSSHSSSVMGLACAVAFQEGTASPLFAACLVFAVVVMYDASGVRLQAGRQAEVLNQIVYELPPDHPLAESRPLKEPIGHTQPQVVAGALVGIFVAYFMHHFYPTATASFPMWKRLAEAASAASRRAVAWRVEELQPPSERVLFHFARAGARDERSGAQGAMDAWRVYSDAIYGGSSTATLAHATFGSAEPAGSGTELSGMGGNQGRGDMTGRERVDGRAGIVHPPHPPTQHGWEARAMRRQQHHHFQPPSSFGEFLSPSPAFSPLSSLSSPSLPSHHCASNAAERASNAAERASNAAGRASNAAERASNASERASDAAERASNAAERASNAAGRASNAAERASNAAERASNAAERASNAAECASDAAEGASDAAERASDAAEGASNAAEHAGDAAERASDAAERASNAAEGASNAAESASNAAERASNTAERASNAAERASNAAERASNAAERASNAAERASNAAEGARKAAEGASNAAEGASIAAEGASNAAEGASNAAEGASNAAEGASNAAECEQGSRLKAQGSRVSKALRVTGVVNRGQFTGVVNWGQFTGVVNRGQVTGVVNRGQFTGVVNRGQFTSQGSRGSLSRHVRGEEQGEGVEGGGQGGRGGRLLKGGFAGIRTVEVSHGVQMCR